MGFIIAVSYTDSNYVTVGEYNTTPVFTIFDTTNNNQEVEQGNIVIVPISENNANPMVIINTRSITLTNSRSGKPLTFYGTYEDDKYKTDSPISFSLATANGSSSLGSGDKIVGDINAILEGVTKVEQILLDNGEAIRVVTYRAELLNEAFNQALADGRIKIYNKNNQDVTYCYNIEFNLTDINIYYFVIE